MKSLFSYIKNVRGEMAYVKWPESKQGISHTVLIILISIVAALFIAALDYVFSGVVSRLITG